MEMFDEKFCWNIFIFDSQLFTVSYEVRKISRLDKKTYSYFPSSGVVFRRAKILRLILQINNFLLSIIVIIEYK